MVKTTKPIVAVHGFLLRKTITGYGKETRWEMLCGLRSALKANGQPRRFAGNWIGPGGKLEDDETPEQALWRETQQEMNVMIVPDATDYLGQVNYHYTLLNESVTWQVHLYRVTRWIGTPKPLDGFDELKWFHLERLPYSKMMADMPIIVPPLKLTEPINGQILRGEISYQDETCRKIVSSNLEFVDRS